MKNKLAILILLIVASACLTFGITAFAETEIVDLNKLKTLAADSTVNEITLNQNINLQGETVTFNRSVSINGGGYTLSNGSLKIEKGEGSSISDIVIENSTGNAIIFSNSSNVKVQNITIKNSADYAILCQSGEIRTTLTSNLAFNSSNNAKGCIMLEDNSLFTLKGSTTVLDVNDYVFIQEAKEQDYTPNGEYRDKNYDKQDKLNVFCLTSGGTFVKRDTDALNEVNYTKDSVEYKCFVFPYDELAPEVGVIKAPSTTVVNQPLDLKTTIEIKDNKSLAGEMFVKYTVTDESGNSVVLTDSTDVFVNGSVVTPTKVEKLSIKAEVSDEYGNATMRYIYIDVVPAINVKPIISSPVIGRTQQTNKEFTIPSFTATDANGDPVTVKVEVLDTANNLTEITNGKYTFQTEGSYCIMATATDTYGNTNVKKYFVTAVNVSPTEYTTAPAQTLDTIVIVFIIVGALAICVGGVNIVMNFLRKNKND